MTGGLFGTKCADGVPKQRKSVISTEAAGGVEKSHMIVMR